MAREVGATLEGRLRVAAEAGSGQCSAQPVGGRAPTGTERPSTVKGHGRGHSPQSMRGQPCSLSGEVQAPAGRALGKSCAGAAPTAASLMGPAEHRSPFTVDSTARLAPRALISWGRSRWCKLYNNIRTLKTNPEDSVCTTPYRGVQPRQLPSPQLPSS